LRDLAQPDDGKPVQLRGNQVISHGVLQRLQWAGKPKVVVNSHACASLLHCAVACAMMSSDWQSRQTGVDRVARRLTFWIDPWFWIGP
jgi:hypothetical protein